MTIEEKASIQGAVDSCETCGAKASEHFPRRAVLLLTSRQEFAAL
ncbi:MAG: hypothetical protein ACP5UI_04055 [Thermoprotei archaeon]|nr:hypothetical protein [TACK group archaeon]